MAYAPSAIAPRNLAVTKNSTRRGPLGWLFAAITASRHRQAEREIARFLGGASGKFTDDTEREIERRFLSTPGRW